MRNRFISLGMFSLLGLAALIPARAQTAISAAPGLLNFQGRLAKPDGAPVSDGTYSVQFSLYDALTGGNQKWTQTVSSLSVKNGSFAALLSGFPAATFNGALWLEIKVEMDAPLSPRQQMVSVAYAMKANMVPDGSIGAAQIADGSISAAKIASGVVPTALPPTGAAGGDLTGTYPNPLLALLASSLSKVSGGAMNSVNGSIGIGTASPLAKLDIQGGSDSTGGGPTALAFSFNGGGYRNFIRSRHNGSGLAGNAFDFYLNTSTTATGSSAPGTGNVHVMTLDGAGNVGIGTTSPTAKLTISDTTFPSVVLTSSSATGSWLNLTNTSAGGRIWSVVSTGSANGEGAGNLVFNTQGVTAAQLKNTGEFIANVVTVLGGSDVAEPYNVAAAGDVKALPGMLVVIDGEKVGQMRVASRAYDTSVAGIISGANGIRPGITLTQKGTIADGALPVASIGRVWCWCDADANGAITAGDMLTSSDTPGHAMRATDHQRRDGAVIGKAMSSLKSGKGLVLVLVSLK